MWDGTGTPGKRFINATYCVPRRRGDGPQIRTKFVRVKDFREEPVIEFAADRIVGQTGDASAQRRVSGGAACWRGVSLLLRESVDGEDRPRLEPFVGSCVTPEVGRLAWTRRSRRPGGVRVSHRQRAASSAAADPSWFRYCVT